MDLLAIQLMKLKPSSYYRYRTNVPTLAVAISTLICSGCQQNNDVAVPIDPATTAETGILPQTSDRIAGVGVGEQGSRIRADDSIPSNLVTGPAKVLFNTREKVIFEIQLPQALGLFKALEGRAPATHDEYMQKIVRANKLQLPKLPEGKVYVYRPEEEELWVENEKNPT